MEQIKDIEHPTLWLESLKAGDIAKGRLLTRYADLSFSVVLTKYNQRYGEEKDIFIHYHFNRETRVVILVCETWQEHINNKNMRRYERTWRNKIPKEYM